MLTYSTVHSACQFPTFRPPTISVPVQVQVPAQVSVKMLIELLPCLCLLRYLPTSLALDQKILENGGGKQPSPLDAKLAELVKDTLKEWHVPGLSIGVVDGDDMWAEVRVSLPG